MAVNSIGSIQENHIKYAKYFSDKQNGDLSVEDFYTLLLSEMTNQDPLEPTSNTEFISQMATFTSMKSQQDSLYYSNANFATSLVGKTVIVTSSTGTGNGTVTGVVSNVSMSDDSFKVTVNGREYALKNVQRVVSDGNTAAAGTVSTDGAYATSLIGKKVTISARNSSGATVLEQGVVDSIEVQDGQFSVIVNGLSYSVSDVVKVQNAVSSAEKTENAASAEESVNSTGEIGAEAEMNDGTSAAIPVADNTDGDDIADVTDEKENLIELFS